MAATLDLVTAFAHQGFASTFSATHTLDASANVCYAVVLGAGISRHASGVTAITVGGVSALRTYTDPDGTAAAIDVYRLVSPPTGAQTVLCTRAGTGYAPVRVIVVSVVGADPATPDDGMVRAPATSPNASPYTHARTMATAADDLTVSVVNTSASFSALAATAGYQTGHVVGTDADGRRSALGTLGATEATAEHRWDLDADAQDRQAFSVTWNINALVSGGGGGGGGGGGSVPDAPPPVAPVTGFEVWTTVQADGGQRLHFVPEILGGESRHVLQDLNTMTLTLPATARCAVDCRPRRVVRTLHGDGSFDEWVIVRRARRRGPRGATIELQCAEVAWLLATAAVIAQRQANGLTVATFERLGLTPAAQLEAVVLPALAEVGVTWVALGDVPAVIPGDLVYSWSNPLEVVKRLAEHTRTEWRLRRDGITRYCLDLVPQIGSAAPLLRVQGALNLQAIESDEDGASQATRVYVQGAAGTDGIHATMARNRWRISALVGTTVTLVDPGGGDGPIALSDQWIGYRLRAIGAAQGILITDTDELTQAATLDTVTGLAVGTVVEFVGPAHEDVLACPAPASFEATYGVVARVLERGDIPGTVNLVSNPAMRLYGSASGPPDGWQAVGGAVVTRSVDPDFWRVGGAAARIQSNFDGQGLRTPTALLQPTATSPYFSGFCSVWLVNGRIRWELVWSDGTVTRWMPDGTTERHWTNQVGSWIYDGADGLGVAGRDLHALGATSAYLRVVQDGPGTAEFYVEAAQITQTALQVPFIEGAGPNQMLQAGNRQLLERALPGVRYELQMVDLSEIEQARWASYPLVVGGPIAVDEPELPILGRTRVVEVRRDLRTRALVKVALSSRPEDLVDVLVRPRLPHRLPRGSDLTGAAAIDWSSKPVPGSPGHVVLTITGRPTGAQVYFVLQDQGEEPPVIGNSAYTAGPSDGSPVEFTVDLNQDDNVQVSAYCQLGSQFSPLRTWVLDANTSPGIALAIGEPIANAPQYTVTVDDDTVEWHLYRRPHATLWPTGDGTLTHAVLDQAWLVGKIRVRQDGGSVDRLGQPLAGVVDAAGITWTGIGGTAWREGGVANGTVVRALAVGIDRYGNVGTRASAVRTIAGTIAPALLSAVQTALTDSSGGALTVGEGVSFNVTWTVNAAVANGTHDLRISLRRDGGPWEEIETLATPTSPLTYRGTTGDQHRQQKHDPYRAYEVRLELVQTSGGVVLSTLVTTPQEIQVNRISF